MIVSKGEPLAFFFDARGNLRAPLDMVLIQEGAIKPQDSWVSCKTQFAPPEIHIWIVGLLKYLKRKYIPDLEVSDESDYWQTGDRQLLEQKMQFLQSKMDQLAGALKAGRLGDMSGLTADEIAQKLERWFRAQRKSGPADA